MISNKLFRVFVIVLTTALLFCNNNIRSFSLGSIKAYPNPYSIKNASTPVIIKLESGEGTFPGETKLSVYDLNDILVFEKTTSGTTVEWSAIDNDGNGISPGFYRIKVIVTRDSDRLIGQSETNIVVQ